MQEPNLTRGHRRHERTLVLACHPGDLGEVPEKALGHLDTALVSRTQHEDPRLRDPERFEFIRPVSEVLVLRQDDPAPPRLSQDPSLVRSGHGKVVIVHMGDCTCQAERFGHITRPARTSASAANTSVR